MKESMHALLNYNSEITGKKRKRNEDKNGQERIKMEARFEMNLMIMKNDKEVAGNVDGGALLHKVF